jgi:hypothetical protein
VTVNPGGEGTGGPDPLAAPRDARPHEPDADEATPPRGIPAFDDAEATPPRGLPILGSPQDDADVQQVDFTQFRSDR